jgi:hypothetical protein
MLAERQLVPGAYPSLGCLSFPSFFPQKMPGEQYFKISYDFLAFLHPFSPVMMLQHNFSLSTEPVSSLNILLYLYTF